MKLHLEKIAGNQMTGYGPGFVCVNGQRFEQNLIVTYQAVDLQWPAATLERLTVADRGYLLQFEADILILGTGSRVQRLSAEQLRWFTEQGLGVETMDNGAACRTFNILSTEGRHVLAAFIVTSASAAADPLYS